MIRPLLIFKEYIRKQTFNPDVLGLLINPFYFVRKDLHAVVRDLSREVSGTVLDLGCGSKPYRSFFEASLYVGMDVAQSGHDHTRESIDVYYNGKVFPFSDNTFDSLVCFEVLEHVFEPKILLKEIYRVLKPGGLLLLTAPFSWDEHEQPYDYARYSSFAVKYLLEQHGFTVTEHKKIMSDSGILFSLFNAYIYKIIMRKAAPRYIKLIAASLLPAPANCVGFLLRPYLPKSDDLYFGNAVLARKLPAP